MLVMTSAPNGLVNKYFYFAMSLLIAIIVAMGFSRTVNDNLLHPSVPRPLILWFHAAAFSGWVAFHSLSLRRHAPTRRHRRMVWRGWHRMIPLGVVTSIIMAPIIAIRKHEPERRPFHRPVLRHAYLRMFFGSPFVAKVRAASAASPRATQLLDALAATIRPRSRPPWRPDGSFFLGVLRDLFVNRRIHKVYLYALAPLIAVQAFVTYTWLGASAWWVRIGHAILG